MKRIPEWRSPVTGSTLLERLMIAVIFPAAVGIYAVIWFAGRAIMAVLS